MPVRLGPEVQEVPRGGGLKVPVDQRGGDCAPWRCRFQPTFTLVGLLCLALLTGCVSAKQPVAVPSGTSGPGLVQRTSIRPAGWGMQIPSNWQRGAACAAQAATLCSSQTGDTDVDIWFDPANQGRRVTIVTCRAATCAAAQPTGAPTFPPNVPGTAETAVESAGRFAFTLSPGEHTQGPYRIDGLFVTTVSGASLAFPVYTVTTSLPDSVHWLAEDILNSFVAGTGTPS